MIMYMEKTFERWSCALFLAAALIMMSCGGQDGRGAEATVATGDVYSALRDSLRVIAAETAGEVGVALLVDGKDTVTVNDVDRYPLMSVFKLHQAVALCHELEGQGSTIDTVLDIRRADLDPGTWSPMMRDCTETSFTLSARRMMEYTLMLSDNNASNLMFSHLLTVARTDSFIATLIPRDGFAIAVTEAEMQRDHHLSQANHSSPMSTALLLERLFHGSILSPECQSFVCGALQQCRTGMDRISAPIAGEQGVVISHKTGSGYVNERGQLMAHNDAAYITLPDGRHYTLVVFVKDFSGSEQEASAVIASVSAVTYRFLRRKGGDLCR